MRQADLIPLGRALKALAESAVGKRPQAEELDGRLNAVAYHAATLRASFGSVPWRVVPAGARSILLGRQARERLTEIFDGVPEIRRHDEGFLSRLLGRRAA